jgi:hypothetical protein
LSTTDIYETLVIGPREFQRQRFSYAHADSGHGVQELFPSGRVGVKRGKNLFPSLSLVLKLAGFESGGQVGLGQANKY